MTRQEAIQLVEDDSRCPRCRWIAAGYILRGKWKVDHNTIAKASRIRWQAEPKKHR